MAAVDEAVHEAVHLPIANFSSCTNDGNDLGDQFGMAAQQIRGRSLTMSHIPALWSRAPWLVAVSH